MSKRNTGATISHVSAKVGSPLERNFLGPAKVLDTFVERYSELSKDAMDQASLEAWKEFAVANPSTRFAFYKGDILVQYDGAIGVLNLALTRPSEENARELAAKYELPMAAEADAQAMRDEVSARDKPEANEDAETKQLEELGGIIVEGFVTAFKMAKATAELKRVAALFPNGKMGLFQGQIYLQISDGIVAELTPAYEKEGLSEEQFRQILQVSKVPFVEGDEAAYLQAVFHGMSQKIDAQELIIGTSLAKNLACKNC
jgi:hypothetical protein